MVFISITTTFSGRGCGAFKARNCDGRGLRIKFKQVMAKEEEGEGMGKRGRCLLTSKAATIGREAGMAWL